MKITGYFVLSIIVILVLLALCVQIPAVQNRLVQKAVTFLEGKIGTQVALGHISISFPKAITLEQLFIRDQKEDTLLYAGKLSVDTDLWALTSSVIELKDVSLENTAVNISRSSKGTFNFDYIIQAFAAPSPEPKDTATSAWTFNVGDLSLSNISVSYADSLQGTNIRTQFTTLNIEVDNLDLENSKLAVDLIELSAARMEMVQWKQTVKTSTTSDAHPEEDEPQFNVSVKEIRLNEVAADYRDIPLGQHARVNLGDLNVSIDEMDLNAHTIDVKEINLSNTFLAYQQSATQEKFKAPGARAEDTTAAAAAGMPWNISLDKLALQDNNVQYYDFNTAPTSKGIDFSHLWLTRFTLGAEKLHLKGSALDGTINELTLVDKSGFSISSLKSSFFLSDTAATLQDFRYVSPSSVIALDAKSTFESLSDLGESYPDANITLNLKNTRIALSELLYFSPTLLDSLPVTLSPSTTVTINAVARGKVKDLTVDKLNLDLLGNTSLKLTGKITGIPQDNPGMTIDLQKLYTTSADIRSVLADTLIPKNIVLPNWLDLRGKFNGSLTSPEAIATLTTDLGVVKLDGKLNQKKKGKATYNVTVKTDELNVGKIIGQPEAMGKLNMNVKVDGAGFTLEELDSRVKMKVESFEYQQYTYRNFYLNGNLKQYFFTGKANMEDKNLDFVLTGDLDYNKDVPKYKFTFDLKNADFKALHLSERPLRTRFALDVNLATSDFAVINGDVDLRNVAIYNGSSLYSVDSLLFVSIDQQGQSKITIRSDIVSGDFEGTIHLASIPEALTRHFNEYYSMHDTAYNKAIPPQKFSFNLVLKNTDLITEILVPDLDPFLPGKIVGAFDSEENTLVLTADVAHIRYGGVGLDSLSLDVHSDSKSLDYTLALRKILVDTLKMEALKITGTVANDSIRTSLIILDSAQRQKYLFGGAFYSEEDAIQFRFLPDQVLMHYAPWAAPRDNYLRFTKEGILAHNFSIVNINEKISLVTKDEADARTAIVFKDLNLQNITNIVEGTILADGLINGDFIVSGKGAFNSELNVKGLKILSQEWGNLALKLNHEATGAYHLNLDLKGDNAELGAKGTFISDSSSSSLDIAADISRINLKIIEPMTGGQIKNSSGIITGELTVKGKPTAPQIRGFLAFENAAVVPSFVNSKFTLKDERISFTGDGVVLDNFKVVDESNNAATIKGLIKTQDYSQFDMNLSLVAKNFQVMNTKPEDSELFYGKVGINTTAKITGTFTQPKVDMEVSLNDDSDFTYIVPESEKGLLEQEGIVRFRDKDAAKDPFLSKINPRDTVKSKFTGLDLTANIELDDKESFSIVIDPVTGDKLTVKGNSTLSLVIDPTGDMQLSGRYEITEGSYDFTFYKLVKRKFSIVKGSTITWAGDPLAATMDIKASYLVETSPAELMGTETTVTTSKARLPFLVYLNIDGNLLTPDISFELDMPKDKQNAVPGLYARLKDINTRESDLNKQVFALLILRRFISDNIFDSQGGAVGSTARRSVSKLLTEQLNRLSQNIKGFELSFDVKSYEDYTSGTAQGQTEVQLGVSKSLLDDRLVVKVSGNVDIEGNASNQDSFSDYIGDLALEYKLTPDGRLRITGFRKSNYDIISGELIETGAGLIYIKDYDTLRELFKANAKEKE